MKTKQGIQIDEHGGMHSSISINEEDYAKRMAAEDYAGEFSELMNLSRKEQDLLAELLYIQLSDEDDSFVSKAEQCCRECDVDPDNFSILYNNFYQEYLPVALLRGTAKKKHIIKTGNEIIRFFVGEGVEEDELAFIMHSLAVRWKRKVPARIKLKLPKDARPYRDLYLYYEKSADGLFSHPSEKGKYDIVTQITYSLDDNTEEPFFEEKEISWSKTGISAYLPSYVLNMITYDPDDVSYEGKDLYSGI